MMMLKNEANDEVSELLVGSDLDEIKVAGRSISLRFISDRLVAGCLRFVYVVFSCGARAFGNDDNRFCGDFVGERSIFLSKIFLLYGEKINRIKLEEDGSLTLNFDKGDVLIFLTKEDLDEDDSVWDVSSVELNEPSNNVRRFVSCAPIEGRVVFFGGQRM